MRSTLVPQIRNHWLRVLFLTVFLLGSPGAVYGTVSEALSSETFSEAAYSEGLPVFLVDHLGFEAAQAPFQMFGVSVQEPIFPLFSVIRDGKPTGLAAIPKKYLGPEADHENSFRAQRRNILNGPSVMFNGRMISQPRQVEAAPSGYGLDSRFDAAFRQLSMAGYLPYYSKEQQVLIGADPTIWEVDHTHYREKGAGVTIPILPSPSWFKKSESTKKKIVSHDISRWGFHLDFSKPVLNLGHQSGLLNINLSAPFEQSGSFYRKYLQGMSVDQISEVSIRNTEYFREFLSLNAESLSDALKAVQSSEILSANQKRPEMGSDSTTSTTAVGSVFFSDRVNSLLSELREHRAEEEQWRDRVEQGSNATLVLADPATHALLQSICDRMAARANLPASLWPRCQMAASWTPAAYSYPGGDIYVTAGLVSILENVDSLYFILGHQLGHIIGRHTSRRMPYWNSLSVPSAILGWVGQQYSLPSSQKLDAGITFTDWFPPHLGAEREIAIQKLGKDLTMSSLLSTLMMHSTEAHLEARRIGDELSVGLGADLSNLVESWESSFSLLFKLTNGKTDFADSPDPSTQKESLEKRRQKLPAQLQVQLQTEGQKIPQTEKEAFQALKDSFRIHSRIHSALLTACMSLNCRHIYEYMHQTFSSPAGKGWIYSLGGLR